MATRRTLKRQVASCCLIVFFAFLANFVNGTSETHDDHATFRMQKLVSGFGITFSNCRTFLFGGDSSYVHVWPEMELGWKIVVGSLIGFLGAAFGSVGGVGGGGIYVPMLTLIIGFDEKSSTAISKCMIMGAASSTVYYNLRLRNPSLDTPLIDYDLALLFQPMLMLGISIGVIFNVIFPDWIITVLLIILFVGTSSMAFRKGVVTWKKETVVKEEAKQLLSESGLEDGSGRYYKPLPKGPATPMDEEVPILQNIYWKDLGLLSFVWIAFLVIKIIKNDMPTCSIVYWILNALQIPIAASVTLYEAISLCRGTRTIKSTGRSAEDWKLHQVLLYSLWGVAAGMVGGLLGLGGGFILGPLFLELGVPPQVSSATSTFAMTFSSSMSVVQYYLLKRFPVPYAAYLVLVAFIAALAGQHFVRKVIAVLGRSSIIIFILASTIFISAICLGGVGIVNAIYKLENHEYMGFDSLCSAT